MPHSYSKIWIHTIWSTHERLPLISSKIESELFQFISQQLIEQGCPVRIVNGSTDHVHCLFLLNLQKSVSELVKQVKGSSSHFINQSNLIAEKFAWQMGYSAFSVSESGVEKVFEYIKKQKEHHRKVTFQQEYENFLRVYNIERGNG